MVFDLVVVDAHVDGKAHLVGAQIEAVQRPVVLYDVDEALENILPPAAWYDPDLIDQLPLVDEHPLVLEFVVSEGAGGKRAHDLGHLRLVEAGEDVAADREVLLPDDILRDDLLPEGIGSFVHDPARRLAGEVFADHLVNLFPIFLGGQFFQYAGYLFHLPLSLQVDVGAVAVELVAVEVGLGDGPADDAVTEVLRAAEHLDFLQVQGFGTQLHVHTAPTAADPLHPGLVAQVLKYDRIVPRPQRHLVAPLQIGRGPLARLLHVDGGVGQGLAGRFVGDAAGEGLGRNRRREYQCDDPVEEKAGVENRL